MQLTDYLDYYGFDKDLHRFYKRDYIVYQQIEICCHYFYPEKFSEVVILIHGYLDHTGNSRNLINHPFKHGYAVAAFDLPGHGLSDGDRGVIIDFSDYAECFELFMNTLTFSDCQVKKSVVAHSTGCSVLIEYLKTVKVKQYRRIILAAPLVRSAHWRMTMFGLLFVKFFEKNGFLKRKFRSNSSDSAYLKFRADDPLQPRQVSLQWLRALIRWNLAVVNYSPFDFPVSILQGDVDITVEWQYNLPVVRRLFPRHNEMIIHGANHQLFNESSLLLDKVLATVSTILKE